MSEGHIINLRQPRHTRLLVKEGQVLNSFKAFRHLLILFPKKV